MHIEHIFYLMSSLCVDNRPIGFFDSGAGGLTVLNRAKRLLPNERYIYLSDTLYAPYGDKPIEYIKWRAVVMTRRLVALGCKAIVVDDTMLHLRTSST